MCCGFEVAGITQVTAGWETTNRRKNWPQLRQPISSAQPGSGRPPLVAIAE